MTESLYLWSKTAASNASADGAISIPEGMAPSGVNNGMRSMMAATAKYRDDVGGALVSTGSTNEYTIATNQGIPAHANGVVVVFRADKTSSGAATTTIDGLAQKSIFRADGSATASGDIISGAIYTLKYSSVAGGYLATELGGPAASTSASGIVELATSAETITGTDAVRAVTPAGLQAKASVQADQETSTSTTTWVAPGVQQYHPSAAKCWGYITVSGGTPTLAASYNVTSIADTAVGRVTVTIATDFSTANYACMVTCVITGSVAYVGQTVSVAAGTIEIQCSQPGVGLTDPVAYSFVMYGDQ